MWHMHLVRSVSTVLDCYGEVPPPSLYQGVVYIPPTNGRLVAEPPVADLALLDQVAQGRYLRVFEAIGTPVVLAQFMHVD